MMLSTIIKHYLYDIGLAVMFENMTANFVIGESFYKTYIKYLNKTVIVMVSNECTRARDLPSDTVFGILREVTDSYIKITILDTKFEIESIYLYEADIYKLFT